MNVMRGRKRSTERGNAGTWSRPGGVMARVRRSAFLAVATALVLAADLAAAGPQPFRGVPLQWCTYTTQHRRRE
jgi:hypothetical protein